MSRFTRLIRRWIGVKRKVAAVPAEPEVAKRWHAWDPTPWDHPFLTPDNLRAFRSFSEALISGLEQRLQSTASPERLKALRFAFTGNIANDMYQRARAIAAHAAAPDLILHPQDTSLLSDPRWEEFDGALPQGVEQLDEQVLEHGVAHPLACRLIVSRQTSDWPTRLNELGKTYRPADLDRWPEHFSLWPMLDALRGYDAVFGTQVPFVPFLANMPYMVTQSGSDMRIVANRGDSYGELHREAYRNATAFLASNPWSIAHARRLGLSNMILLPAAIDESIYKPGHPTLRAEWQARVGGSFFVLSTARMNDEIKGSSVALQGFVRFAREAPEARLVIIEWGQQKKVARKLLADAGLADRTVFLPLSGKRRLIQYLQSADCLLDQFVLKQLGSTAREAMGCGLPVVMQANAPHYDACYDGKLPVLNAATEREIADSIRRLHDDANYRDTVRVATRQWFLDNVSGRRWAKSYQTVLAACALGLEFDFSASPLKRPLDDEEQEYHRVGLEQAPAHP